MIDLLKKCDSMFRWNVLLVAAIAFVMQAGAVYGQTTYGSITGSVTDPSGAVIPNVTVTATNAETGITATARSNDAGTYTIPQLSEGTYVLKADAAGFKQFVVQDLALRTRDIRRVDMTLQVGPTSTTVEVSGGALPQLDTETARVSDVKTSTTLNKLPLNARWLWDFFNQVPGMQSSGDGYRFFGSTGNLANFSIDGTTMNDGKGWQIGPLLNYMGAYQEVKVDVANNGAEFAGIGNVEVVTKSGSNQVHGAVFDQFWTPGLKARNYFADRVDPTRFHIFGGDIGGPVYIPKLYNGKNKTFFFAQVERSAGNGHTNNINVGVPLQSWRNGDFSGLSPGTVIFDPRNNQPFPGNRIPTDRLNPVSQKIQERFYPLPNFGDPSSFTGANYREEYRSGWTVPWNTTARLDHHFSDHDFVFGRVTRNWAHTSDLQGLSTIGLATGFRSVYAATASYTHVFNASLLNEVRWGMNFNDNTWKGPLRGQDELKRLGLTGLAPNLPDSPGMLDVFWDGIALQQLYQWNGGGPPGWRNFNNQFQDYVSVFHGKHNIKAGVDFSRALYDDQPIPDALFGNAWFSSRFTSGGNTGQGHPYADFLLGIPSQTARAFPGLRQTESRWQYAFFFTDQLKVTPTLTLTLGLRYQLHTPWREHNGRMSVFDIGSGSLVVPDDAMDQISPLFPTGYVKVAGASSLNLPQTMVRADRNDFAPRISVAWRPIGPKTVFHAGYNIFYDIVPFEFLAGGSPFQLSENPHTNPANNPDVIFPRVFPDRPADTVYGSVGLPGGVNPNLRTPMTQMYTANVEREVWNTVVGLTYIGTAQRYGTYSYNYNSPLPDSNPYISKPRPFPKYGDISYRTNGAGHQYHGLMTTLKRNMANGLLLNASWTWQRDRIDLERWDAPENPFDRKREVAVNSVFPTHRIIANGIYELPFGNGRQFARNAGRLKNLVVGGWSLSSTYGYNSGQFLTPYWSGPDPTGTAWTESSTAPIVTRRPNQVGNPNLPSGQRSLDRWFDAGAFTAPLAGQFGSAAKGVIKGPNCLMWNAGITKQLTFGEKSPRVLLQAQFKNLPNRRNWSNPNTTITNVGGVGHITADGGISDAASPRAGTLVLRIEW